MKKELLVTLLCTIILTGCQTIKKAEFKPDFQAGFSAYESGDFKTALKHFKPLSKQGDISSQRYLGNMYQHGFGISENYNQAIYWYTKSAEQGDMFAQYNLGELNYTLENYQQAIYWLEKSAEQGSNSAQMSLGDIYYDGENYREAKYWYTKTAKQGNFYAQYILGFMFHNGYGVPKNYKQAVYWYRKSAEQGYADAQNNLGIMYEYGYGVQANYILAYMWYNISTYNNDYNDDETSKENREKMEYRLSQSEVDEAQELSKLCIDSAYKNCGYDLVAPSIKGKKENSSKY